MEKVFQYRIPVWHPLAIHFPLVLLIVGAAAAVCWAIWGAAFWRRCALFLFSMGMLGTIFAYLTGEAMEEQSEGVPIVEELVELHEELALWTLIAAGLVLAGFAWISVRAERALRRGEAWTDPVAVRLGLTVVALLAAALVAFTSHVGGTMVWGV